MWFKLKKYAGYYPTIEEAIIARDNYLEKMYKL